MRDKLRLHYLAFRRNWTDFFSNCWHCGAMGAAVHSLLYPKRLCNTCGTHLSRNPSLVKRWSGLS